MRHKFEGQDFLMFLEVSSANQGCIYLIKNTIVKYYYNLK